MSLTLPKQGRLSESLDGPALRYRTANVNGIKIFDREAGRQEAPDLLLLHGFPSASQMFRDLIPLLADRFRLVAPDLPGFGQSDMPPRGSFSYAFDNLATVIEVFTAMIRISWQLEQKPSGRDIPDAQVELLDMGHFTLETHSAEIGAIIGEFLQQKLDAKPGAFSGGRRIG
jgi:alpha-beta hydrolase superfamily lysophospholipase